jgi:peptide/nickel transport system ATP-binding protein
MAEPLLQVRGLSVCFDTPDGEVTAVDGADLDIPAGKTVCLVGESGSGKSVMARSIMRLDAANARLSGQMLLRGADGQATDLATLPPRSHAMRALRGGDIGMVFQEPMSSLSPVHTIGTQMLEVVRLHLKLRGAEARERCIEMLARVGVPRPAERFDAHAFELSGGMRQRAMIAMALVCKPRLLIADEPTTALDVSIQAGVLALIRELQAEMGMAVLFITHDLGVVAQLADEVAVMYLGRVVERAPVTALFEDPCHPYTAALLKSMPGAAAQAVGRKQPIPAIRGSVPSPLARPAGCTFHPRCDFFQPGRCDAHVPPFTALAPARAVRCVLYEAAAAQARA